MVSVQETILKLRKKIARAVIRKGGNAVSTYRQSVDHEGGGDDKSDIRMLVARAYGTVLSIKERTSQVAKDEKPGQIMRPAP